MLKTTELSPHMATPALSTIPSSKGQCLSHMPSAAILSTSSQTPFLSQAPSSSQVPFFLLLRIPNYSLDQLNFHDAIFVAGALCRPNAIHITDSIFARDAIYVRESLFAHASFVASAIFFTGALIPVTDKVLEMPISMTMFDLSNSTFTIPSSF